MYMYLTSVELVMKVFVSLFNTLNISCYHIHIVFCQTLYVVKEFQSSYPSLLLSFFSNSKTVVISVFALKIFPIEFPFLSSVISRKENTLVLSTSTLSTHIMPPFSFQNYISSASVNFYSLSISLAHKVKCLLYKISSGSSSFWYIKFLSTYCP